jgi:hypothetical protein
MSQVNPLCSYLKQTKYHLFFSFTKSENKRVEQLGEDLVLVGGERIQGKGVGR